MKHICIFQYLQSNQSKSNSLHLNKGTDIYNFLKYVDNLYPG